MVKGFIYLFILNCLVLYFGIGAFDAELKIEKK